MDEERLLQALMETGASFQIFLSVSWISFLLLIAICGPLNLADWRERLGLNRARVIPSVGWCLGGAVLIGALDYFLDPYLDPQTREAIELIAMGMHTPVLFFVSVVLIAPILEELIFRGYAYSGWIKPLGFWGTSLLSSLIFMACHLQYGWTGLLSVFVVGWVLSAIRWRTGSIYPCIALHLLNNLAHYIGQLPVFAE